MDDRDLEIVRLFDTHTRSVAVMQLIGLCQMWLVTEDQLAVYSDDLQARVHSQVTLFRRPE